MKRSNPGICFRETMKGYFSLGEQEPEAGKEAGESQRAELAMHASINIRDMEDFIADPDHQGEIIGSIDFPPLGNAMPATHGVFNLFSPTGEPKTKYMVYELGFEHEGQAYYLAGRKIVRDGPHFDLWSDTTTLYTRLFQGQDSSGEVIGAGVLRLGVKALAKLVTTLKATNTSSTGAATRTISRFGQFFLGQLWNSYGRKTADVD